MFLWLYLVLRTWLVPIPEQFTVVKEMFCMNQLRLESHIHLLELGARLASPKVISLHRDYQATPGVFTYVSQYISSLFKPVNLGVLQHETDRESAAEWFFFQRWLHPSIYLIAHFPLPMTDTPPTEK